MKVHAVSFQSGVNSSELHNYEGILNPFLYTQNIKNTKEDFKANTFKIVTALLAALAVGITLINIKGKNQFSKNIVEVKDKLKGLNKITKYKKAVEDLKEYALYPLMSTIKGDKTFLNNNELKSGIIIGGKNTTESKKVIQAFCEHAKALGIRCIDDMPAKLKQKNEKRRWVFSALKEANQHFKRTKEYTIINIGNINSLADFKEYKPTMSKVESFLKELDQKTYPGVLWIAHQGQGTLPYYFNNMPVLITKLVD